jgi:DNA replication protein DnaC
MVNFIKYGISEDFINIGWNDYLSLPLSSKEKNHYKYIYNIVKKWFGIVQEKNPNMGLFFTGCNGSGKSSLACLLIKSLLEKNIIALRITSIKLQSRYFEEWRIPSEGLLPSVLIIDEVGKEPKTKGEFSESTFEYILKYRTERLLPTVLVANTDIVYLCKRYGKTVESVLRGKFIPLNFPEIDLRQKLAEKNSAEILE